MEIDVEVDIEERERRHRRHGHDCGCDDKWQNAIEAAGFCAETPDELTELLVRLAHQIPSGTDAVSGTGVATPNNPNLLGA